MLASVRGLCAVVLASLACGGCTVLTSDTIAELSTSGRAPSGVHYALPRALVDVELRVGDRGSLFELAISDPKYVADHKHRYFLRYRPHPSYEDEIRVEMVGDGRPFLKSVSATTIDKTKDIIVSLAKAAGYAGGFQSHGEGERLLGQVTIDPSDPRDLARAGEILDTEMRRYLRQHVSECTRLREDSRRCTELQRILGSARAEPLVMLSASHAQQPRFGKPADCSIGICYRPKEPFLVSFSIAGVSSTKILEIPNAAAPIAIDIRRAFLVQKIHELEFDNDGFLTRVKIDKESELLAAAQLPLQVASAVAEGLQLRIDVTQRQTQNAKTEADLIRERGKLQSLQGFQAATGKEQDTARTYELKPLTPTENRPPPKKQSGGGGPKVDPDLTEQSRGVRQ